MSGLTIVDTIKELVRDWEAPRVPRYLSDSDAALEMPMKCSSVPVQRQLELQDLPVDLQAFWSSFASAKLFEDVTYGQWGLVLTDFETSNRLTRKLARERAEDFVFGDRVVGEFIGDQELLVVRCDASAIDVGNVVIALPMSPRREWYNASHTLSSFLETYQVHEGKKYWEPV